MVSRDKVVRIRPSYSVNVGALGTLRLLEAVRSCGSPIRFYPASSRAARYGEVANMSQDERMPFHARSPYACARLQECPRANDRAGHATRDWEVHCLPRVAEDVARGVPEAKMRPAQHAVAASLEMVLKGRF